MVSVLVVLPTRELTDWGTEPYQEFLTLTLKLRIAFFAVMLCWKIELKFGIFFSIILFVRASIRVILGYGVIVYMFTALRWNKFASRKNY